MGSSLEVIILFSVIIAKVLNPYHRPGTRLSLWWNFFIDFSHQLMIQMLLISLLLQPRKQRFRGVGHLPKATQPVHGRVWAQTQSKIGFVYCG